MATQQTATWEGHYFAFNEKQSDVLGQLSTRLGVQASLLSALRILHYRLTASEAVYLPVKQHNADGTASESFLSNDIDGNSKIADVLEHAQNALVSAKERGLKQDGHDIPVTTSFCFEHWDEDEGYSGDASPETPMDATGSWQFRGTSGCCIVYSPSRQSQRAVESLALDYADILDAVLFDQDKMICKVSFHGVVDRLQPLGALRAPKADPVPENLIAGLQDSVTRHGTAAALVDKEVSLTYEELDDFSSFLAADILSRRGEEHSSDRFMALCIRPSALAIAAIVAILKTGCAYVPLDVRQASERTVGLLETAENPCVLVTKDSPQFLLQEGFPAPVLDITCSLEKWRTSDRAHRAQFVVASPSVNDIACLLFTSGTTGRPKAVRIQHKNILSLATNGSILPIYHGDNVSQMTNLAWDVHMSEIWVTFIRGATLYSFDQAEVLDPVALTERVRDCKITTTILPNALVRHVLNEKPEFFQHIQHILMGGEMARFEQFNKIRAQNPNISMINAYGPTECCVVVTANHILPSHDIPTEGNIPIGGALDSMQLIILDDQDRLVPPGVVGNIFIRGQGVADGYHKLDTASDAAFVHKTLLDISDHPIRLYNSGDRGRWNWDGQIEFLGRSNADQIKVQGQRLELPDVEANITRVLGVQDVGVAYHKPAGGQDGILTAYLVPDRDSEQGAVELTSAALTSAMPTYMIPEAFYLVQRVPVTLNGKVDRRALASMANVDQQARKNSQAIVHGADTDAEGIVCQLFASILGGGVAISPDTNFMQHGGNSLMTTKLRHALRARFGVTIPIGKILEAPTPRELARKISQSRPETEKPSILGQGSLDAGEASELSFAQHRMWFLAQLHPEARWYHCEVMLVTKSRLNEDILDQTFADIFSRHDILRTVYFEDNGVPKSRVTNHTASLRKVDVEGSFEDVRQVCHEDFIAPYDFTSSPPVRALLVRWGDRHVVMVSMHHIVHDGYSHNIWNQELMQVYNSLHSGKSSPLARPLVQYRDYAKWQHSSEYKSLVDSQLEYWIPHLQGAQPARFEPDFTELPEGADLGEAGSIVLHCGQERRAKLDAVKKSLGSTWFMLLFAAFRAVQFEVTGQEDGMIGFPIANRHKPELVSLLGFFVNTQILRLKCAVGTPFSELVRQARDLSIKAFDNQDVSFDTLVSMLRPNRSPTQNPLTEIMFAYQTIEEGKIMMGDTVAENGFLRAKLSRFDLEVQWYEEPDDLRLELVYRANVFKSSTFETIGQKMFEFLDAIIINPNLELATSRPENLLASRQSPAKAYWDRTLDGFNSIKLALSSTRPEKLDTKAQSFDLELPSSITHTVETVAEALGISTAALYTTAYLLTMGIYSDQDDLIIGIPNLGQDQDSTVSKVLPLRVFFGWNDSQLSLVQKVHDSIAGAIEHSQISFQGLCEAAEAEGASNRHALFQHVFSHDGDTHEKTSEFLRSNCANACHAFDLAASIKRQDSQAYISFAYQASLFSEDAIVGMTSTYARVLSQLVDQTRFDKELCSLVLSDGDPGIRSDSSAESLIELFEFFAKSRSSTTAVVCGDESLTFEQLDRRATRLASYMKANGLGKGHFMALMVSPTLDMIVCILAAWKVGAAYIPVSPKWPGLRVKHILKDSSATHFVTTREHAAGKLEDEIPAVSMVYLDDPNFEVLLEAAPSDFSTTFVSSDSISHCFYTSGTTGVPKGVLLRHRGVLNLRRDLQPRYFGGSDMIQKVTMMSDFVFDFSMEQFALAFLSGNTLVMLPDGPTGDDKFYKYLSGQKITYMSGTPSVLSRLDLSKLSDLRMMTVSGEMFLPNHFERIRTGFHGPINNSSAPTECSIYNLLHRFEADDPFINCLGRPIANHQVYLLSEALQPVPQGAPGELFIAGPGVSAGYLNLPEQTEKKFLPNPFVQAQESPMYATMYRTGDKMRQLADGRIQPMGRRDDQVKLRGIRIELSEIQQVMATCPDIVECAVVPKFKGEDKTGNVDFLVGYYTTSSESLSEGDIKTFLEKRLPPAYVPSRVVLVPGRLPTTIQGKLDLRRLPEVEKLSEEVPREAARNATEAELCRIWGALLGNEVGIHDNFFDAGGDSIMSIQLIHDMSRAGIHVTVKDLFAHPTVARIAEFAAKKSTRKVKKIEAEQGLLTGALPLSPVQQWFFNKQFTKQDHFNQSFIIHTPRLEGETLNKAWIALQERHDALRLSFEFGNGTITQKYQQESANPNLLVFEDNDSKLAAKLDRLQCSLSLADGRVAVMAYIASTNSETDTVWMALHHLVTDVVSWRIMTRDLQSLYNGKSLSAKSSSLRQWNTALQQYSPTMAEEAYWREVHEICQQEVLDAENNELSGASIQLSEVNTKLLSRSGPRVLGSSTLAILLTSVSRALTSWHGSNLPVTLEGIGRQDLSSTLDVNNTVGWFTTMYPFVAPTTEDLASHVSVVTRAIKDVPRKGFGYGILHGYDNIPGVTFNYLGQVENHAVAGNAWRLGATSGSQWGRNFAEEDSHLVAGSLTLTARIENRVLHFDIAGFVGDERAQFLQQAISYALDEIVDLILEKVTALDNGVQVLTEENDMVEEEKAGEPTAADKFIPFFHFDEAPRQGPTVFLLPPGDGGAESYFNNIVAQLDEPRLVTFNNYPLAHPEAAAEETFETLAQRYIGWLREIQPQGPYHLFGWCFGGVLAFEICRQLTEAGETVASLSLVNSFLNLQHNARASGLDEESTISKLGMHPINWRYQPAPMDPQILQDRLGHVNLFKAGAFHDPDREHLGIHDLYKDIPLNGLDAFLPPSKIDKVVMDGKTHYSWIKDKKTVGTIVDIIRSCL
ncbi:hypothetical protein PFICI_09514 [Pestalotiopsis fici W106-1]|uniref:Carrier domain-containing protein n=1 Tax=Pestalotiopsis fici (strain W106-1 / CGMCC3.15140) TaxID=1229662 RepID=W3X3E1_PESFW|nr:uncharacterized protein PFICI_09514 [Pestalotiopsis fici W106-1]ETS79661.1 hypothetical protein PFICI_09514 [Pestalotiopsis fici W106-1]